MDKVELSVQDIEALLNWRDQHQDEVRSHPAPLKAVEIVMPHNGYHIKGVRDGDQLRLHLSQSGEQLGNCRFIRRAGGMWASTRNRMKVGRDDLQAVLTVYCSVMALMAYGRREPEPREALLPSRSQARLSAPQRGKASGLLTYSAASTGRSQRFPGGPMRVPGASSPSGATTGTTRAGRWSGSRSTRRGPGSGRARPIKSMGGRAKCRCAMVRFPYLIHSPR